MTRRLLSAALLGYLALATWMLTSRFTAWGDDLAGTIAGAWAEPPPPAPSAGGIDFIECFGCDRLPGVEGYAVGVVSLLIGGGPLALLGLVLDRRRTRDQGRPAGIGQFALVVQIASVASGALVLCVLLRFAVDAGDVLHWVTACAFADVAAGVPALAAWRRLMTPQPFRAVFQ